SKKRAGSRVTTFAIAAMHPSAPAEPAPDRPARARSPAQSGDPPARRPVLRRRSAPALPLDARARACLLGRDRGCVGSDTVRGRDGALARFADLLLAPQLAPRCAADPIDDQSRRSVAQATPQSREPRLPPS